MKDILNKFKNRDGKVLRYLRKILIALSIPALLVALSLLIYALCMDSYKTYNNVKIVLENLDTLYIKTNYNITISTDDNSIIVGQRGKILRYYHNIKEAVDLGDEYIPNADSCTLTTYYKKYNEKRNNENYQE